MLATALLAPPTHVNHVEGTDSPHHLMISPVNMLWLAKLFGVELVITNVSNFLLPIISWIPFAYATFLCVTISFH